MMKLLAPVSVPSALTYVEKLHLGLAVCVKSLMTEAM